MPPVENPISDNFLENFLRAIQRTLDGPVVWFRESIVTPNRKQYNWYHKKYRRVPTIDQCYDTDPICAWEADQQFIRDRKVDEAIITILRFRFEDCMLYEQPDHFEKCQPLKDTYIDNTGNYFAKYGDMHLLRGARTALMKQKHRLLWERRYGPVGTGNIPKEQRKEEE